MSSEQNIKKRVSPKDVTSISKKVKLNYDSLSTYNTDYPLNQSLISLVQSLYKSRDIRNIKTATTTLDILTQEKNINKFNTKFASITTMMSKKSAKKVNKKDVKMEKISDVKKEVEEVVFTPSNLK